VLCGVLPPDVFDGAGKQASYLWEATRSRMIRAYGLNVFHGMQQYHVVLVLKDVIEFLRLDSLIPMLMRHYRNQKAKAQGGPDMIILRQNNTAFAVLEANVSSNRLPAHRRWSTTASHSSWLAHKAPVQCDVTQRDLESSLCKQTRVTTTRPKRRTPVVTSLTSLQL